MKRPLIVLTLVLLMAGAASAYEITIDAPQSIQKGEPFVVTGTSNLPAGTTVQIQLSRSEYTLEIIETKQVVIQGEGDKNFTLTFETRNLTKGQHKVEVLDTPGYSFLGDSKTLRQFQVIDRSNELEITSPKTQYSDTTLTVAGRIAAAAGRGVQILVTGPSGPVFGPEYIGTSSTGTFSKDVRILRDGTYEVSFSDAKGFVGNATFVVEKIGGSVTIIPTTTGTKVPAVTFGSSVSASAVASREAPAYFVITPAGGKVRIYTSTNIDWVIEYIDPQGARQKVNQKGRSTPEEVTVESPGGELFVMVYPNTYSDRDTVTLSAENAEKVEVPATPPAGLSKPSTATATTTKSSPATVIPVIGALAAIALVFGMTRRHP